MNRAYQNEGRWIKWITILFMVVFYAVPVFISLYGLKCILFKEGIFTASVPSRLYRHSFHLMRVHGAPAVTAGYAYFCVALVWLFSGTLRKPDADDSFLIYMLKALILAGAGAMMIFLLAKADHQLFGHF